jgi:hypothetical protein
MPIPFLIPSLILGGTSLLGGILGGRKQTTDTRFSRSGTNTTTPIESPEQSQLFRLLASRAIGRLNNPTPLGGYESTGLQNINRVSDALRMSAENNLTSRGLSTSPIAANVSTNLDLARGGESARFLNSLPLLMRELALGDEAAAAGIYGLKPFGQTSTYSESGTGQSTGTPPGGMIGGGLSSLGAMLGFLAALGKLPGMGAGGKP